MIKFGMASRTGRTVVGIGLSRENTERLLAGQPIHVHAEDWAGPREHAKRLVGIDLLIVGGETEESIALDLAALRAEYAEREAEGAAPDA
jgi:hypothetical protein